MYRSQSLHKTFNYQMLEYKISKLNCKSLLCSLFYEQTCSRFTRLSSSFVRRHHAQNTTLWCFRPYKPYIFWKLKIKGYLNWYSQVSHTQIHKHKYTKTQRHVYSIWQSARKTQHVLYFWKEACSRISKITFPCVKLTNTKIQIHKYTNTAYDKLPERPSMCYIF